MESRKYVSLTDIDGIRIACKCGLSLEGNANALLKKIGNYEVCPLCKEHFWTTGTEDQSQQGNGDTELKAFLRQWRKFTDTMAASNDSRKFTLAFQLTDDSKIGEKK